KKTQHYSKEEKVKPQ
ncbi:unnamed protein product, partial [Allacma fusca]